MSSPRNEKAEEDVETDPHVAGSRDSGDDDTYVGRRSSDEDFDAGETGAERRAES